jgi:sulfide:quinone oxidoreductase
VTVHQDALMRVDTESRTVRTDRGSDLPYDALLVATGAHLRRAVPRVMTFEGPGYVEPMHGLVQDIEQGYTRSVAFVAPPGVDWTLPLYELVLQTADRAYASGMKPDLTVVSAEERPLQALGREASDLVARLLDAAGVRFVSGTKLPEADRTVALPVPSGQRLAGLPFVGDGFLPVDEHGRVAGAERVWAAGDGTDHAVKQGGLATQQGEAAARSIAAFAGRPVDPHPYRPELRAMLWTGSRSYFLRRSPDREAPTEVSQVPLWDPPTKIAGRRLGPFLDELDATTPRANRFERRMTESRR